MKTTLTIETQFSKYGLRIMLLTSEETGRHYVRTVNEESGKIEENKRYCSGFTGALAAAIEFSMIYKQLNK